ncbi:hypothetical protein EON83_15925 [bacterium]|nr:MAG: hypothetical protein EON83_15925 [bacterium]
MQRFLVLGATTLLVGLGAHAADSYSTYRNVRFGYAVLYPSNLVSPRPEAPNGDGRVFKSGDGHTTLTVWGENNVFDRSLKTQMNVARRDWGKDKGHITYWKMGSGFYVLSGTTGQEIFYEKTIPVDGGFATMLWQYPKSQKTKFDAAVTRTTKAFGAGRRVSKARQHSAPKAPRVALDTPNNNVMGY